MVREKIDITDTRKILIKSIMNTDFIREIRGFADPNLFEENYSRLLLNWCFEYYDKFNEAPQEKIKDIYQHKAEYTLTDADKESIENILESLSKEFISTNIEYYSDMAEKYFNKLKLNKLSKEIVTLVQRGKTDDAIQSVKSFTKVERKVPQGVDLLRNKDALYEAFTETNDVLFKLDGVVGQLLGPFNRGDLSAVIAPQKRGKSYMLADISTLAVRKRLRVWHITLEMTKNQVIRRFFQNWSNKPSITKEIEIPFFDSRNNIRFEKKTIESPTLDELEELQSSLGTDASNYLKIFSYPRNTFRCSDLKTMLENALLYDNDIPDLVVVDYADIMESNLKNGELRHKLDQIWGDLASIANQFNIHILTASQANKQTFNRDIEQGDSAEANAKIAHISKYFAINQTLENKKQSCVRIAVMADRHSEFLQDKQAVVLQNLSCGKALLDSRWIEEVPNLTISKNNKDKEE